jgi:hypothetical protein
MTVANAYSEIGWQLCFIHITSQQAEGELTALLARLDGVVLNEEPDTRQMRFSPGKEFSVKNCYSAMNFGGTTCLGNSEVWNSVAPKKSKIFTWLALHNRLNARERLARQGVISNANCPFGCQTEEVINHMLFHCPHTSHIWNKFQVQGLQGLLTIQDTISNPRHAQPTQRQEWSMICIAIAWNIWLTRNHKVFDNASMPAHRVEANC